MWITAKKAYIFSGILISLFCLASFVLAQGGGGGGAVTITNPLKFGTFTALLTNIATQVGALIASLGVVMIIIAGILYLTSAGSPERIGVAKKALIYAIVGIAIGVAAQAIIDIVLGIVGSKSS